MRRFLTYTAIPGLLAASAAAGAWWLVAGGSGPAAPIRRPVSALQPIEGALAKPAVPLPGLLLVGQGKPAPELSGSWPGFRGERRDGVSTEYIPLAETWGANGPPVFWSVAVAGGYAAPAVRNGRVYLLDYDEERGGDALRCLSLADGREIWRRWYSVHVRDNHGRSRTTPAVTDSHVVTLGPKCHVLCLDAADGQARWSLDLVKTYGATVPKWYAGQCPLIARIDGRECAVLATGGKALIVAVDCLTGRELWRAPNPHGWKMTHSSVATVEFDGRPMFVACFSGGVAGVDAADGRILWTRTDWRISPANVPTPVPVGGERILLCGAYEAGAMLLQLTGTPEGGVKAKTVWRVDCRVFSSYQQTPVFYDGYVYGVLDRDAGPLREQLVCLDLSGRHVWTSGKTARFGGGGYIVADGKIILLDDDGVLTLAAAGPGGFGRLASAKVLPGTETWAPPALAGGRLLVRDMNRLVCLDLRAASPANSKGTSASDPLESR